MTQPSLSRAWLLNDVRRRFGLIERSNSNSTTIGAELEVIPLFSDTHLPVPVESATTPCSADVLKNAARKNGWCEVAMGVDPSAWELLSGARISFEPGGQIEVSSAAHATMSGLIAELTQTTSALNDAFEQHGAVLEMKGVDPYNRIEDVPLQLHRDRYERMNRYFNSIGPSGARMMRQTASVQVNVEPGEEPLKRWTLLNRLAPVLTAMFANSRTYAGEATEYASYRAHLWRSLDSSRTGIFTDGDSVESYCDFALDAGYIFGEARDGRYESFRSVVETGASAEDWNNHVSTLFPEVRPRRYFEARSPDMIDLRWIAAPIAVVAGICYDENAAASATELLETVDSGALACASIEGLRNDSLATLAREIGELAFKGCKSLGAGYISIEDLDTVGEFIGRYPANGRSPADD